MQINILLRFKDSPGAPVFRLFDRTVFLHHLAAAVYQQGNQPGDHGAADDKEDSVQQGLVPGGGMNAVGQADIEHPDDDAEGDSQSADGDGYPLHFGACVLIHIPVP